ncbi:hypothetical protein Ddye_003972 [Dipteronia dyeriana]|uniref:Uncharacterized protein n=1 Tax=Dipteronia dyeriana TaxID=168575 RepID=A0AAE0CWI2_9ROSI|nr:hypothetical protein Ddye_003972 [Dipteronia dyeriana]
MVGCLEEREHDSESMGTSIFKDNIMVPGLYKGMMVKVSGDQYVNTKIHVDGFVKSGEGFILGGKEKGKEKGRVDDKLASLEDVENKKTCTKSIRAFGSNEGSSGGVADSGDQVLYINFEKGQS